MILAKLRQLPSELHFLYAGTTITRLGAFVFPYLTIYLSDARGFGVARVGQILSVGSIGLLLGNFAGGWLTDRWRRKMTLILALLLNATGFAGLAWQYESPWAYAASLFVGYFGMGLYGPAANTIIADLTSEQQRSFAYTVNYVCINLGMALGPLIAGVLAGMSYRLIFIGDVATSLVCALLIAIGVTETRSARHRQEPALNRDVSDRGRGLFLLNFWRCHPLVFVFCLANFFLIAPLMGLEYSVPLLVKTVFLEQLVFVGLIYSINALCILSLSFLIERIVRCRNEMLMMVVAAGFWAAGLFILVAGFSITALIVCTAVWTIGEIIASILVPTFIARHVAPAVKGRFMALNDIVRSFAGVVCPIGLGLIWHRSGATAVVYVLAALPVIGALCYLGLLVHASWPRRAAPMSSLATES